MVKRKKKPLDYSKPHLQVIWTKNHLLKSREYEIAKSEQAFNWFWRINGDLIVLRNVKEGYDPHFSESDVPSWMHRKEGYKEHFDKFMKEHYFDSHGIPTRDAKRRG